MRAFVTGATGFIGSYLVKELAGQNCELLCLKRESSDLYRLEAYKNRVKWINISDDWHSAFKEFQPEFVFNLAWDGVSSADRVIWEKQIKNIELQQKMLDLSVECGVRKFIGIGSQSEYGDFEGVVDEAYPANPKTAYAATKLACLDILRSFCTINKLEWYWFRLFPLFGATESDRWLIPSLIKNISTQDYMDLTPGEQQLPYLYVGECAKAIASPIFSDDRSGVYNVCADNPQPLKSLVISIKDMVNPQFKLNFGAQPYRYGQSMYMCGKTDKLSENLYRLDTTTYIERLEETVNYYINLYGIKKR